MCHSQGALACRNALQIMRDSRVGNFISLSGPQMGQFGMIGPMAKYFPTLETDLAYLVLYLELAQEIFAPANYWNDPFRQADYLTENLYLPIVNNQTFNPNSEEFKKNFVKTHNVLLFGSPADGIIQPWNSALFDFWDIDEARMVPLRENPIYTNDWIGLKTLDVQGRLQRFNVPGVEHVGWLLREDLFQKYLAPFLD